MRLFFFQKRTRHLRYTRRTSTPSAQSLERIGDKSPVNASVPTAVLLRPIAMLPANGAKSSAQLSDIGKNPDSCRRGEVQPTHTKETSHRQPIHQSEICCEGCTCCAVCMSLCTRFNRPLTEQQGGAREPIQRRQPLQGKGPPLRAHFLSHHCVQLPASPHTCLFARSFLRRTAASPAAALLASTPPRATCAPAPPRRSRASCPRARMHACMPACASRPTSLRCRADGQSTSARRAPPTRCRSASRARTSRPGAAPLKSSVGPVAISSVGPRPTGS